jgi:hypothetical protein
MEFQKVSITPEGQDPIQALFNPTQYSVDKGNTIAQAAIPGLEAPILQYVHGNMRTLSMDLFFDTFEEGTDVTQSTDQIYNLLYLDPSTHAPPICDITWGTFNFRGVLDHVGGKFNLFLANGTPVRATLSVVFNEFIDVDVLVQEQPTESADHRKTRVVRTGDRLDNIAAEEFGNPAMWRAIADENDLDDPSQLEPGYVLVIPRMR